MNFSKLKQSFSYYSGKLLAWLRIKTVIGGIEISDYAARLAYFDNREWKIGGVRFEPGVIEGGKIKDYEKLVQALKVLKSKVFKEKDAKRRISVVASLGSINIYSQVFSLPIVEGENLEKAIQLNIQMISPVEASQGYSGWQLVGREEDALRLEILSAFIEKQTVDDLGRALFDAGFLIIVLESRAMALTRILRELGEGIDKDRSYIMVSIDGSGIDFLIVRRGQLYFEYFNPWRDIMDAKGQVAMDSFRAAVLRSLHQVLNFYGQHWSDPVSEIVLSATALGDDAAKIIQENFSMPLRSFKLKFGQEVGPEWLISLGCGLRGIVPRGEDKELSLLDIGAVEEFKRERFITFIKFWRLATPVVFVILLGLFFLADLFLIQTRRSLESQALFNLSSEQATENQTLQVGALEFNKIVAMIKSVQEGYILKSAILGKLSDFMSLSGIALGEINLQSVDQPISFRGSADSEDKILNFKNNLEEDPQFEKIDLPLAAIQSEGGVVSFHMTFNLSR